MDNKTYNDRQIDNYFAGELDNLSVTPPNSVWEGIEEKLNHKRKLHILWFRIALAAGIALIIGFSGVAFYKTSKNSAINNNTLAVEIPKTENSQSQSINTKNNQPLASKKSIKTNFSTNTLISPQSLVYPTLPPTQPSPEQGKELVYRNFHKPNSLNSKVFPGHSIALANRKASRSDLDETLAYLNPLNGDIKTAKNDINDISGIENLSNIPITGPVFGPEKLIAMEEPVRQPDRWSIEATFAPVYSYRNITQISNQTNTLSEFNNNETGLVTYSGSIKISYKPNNKLIIKTGVLYSVMGQILHNAYSITSSTQQSDRSSTIPSIDNSDAYSTISQGVTYSTIPSVENSTVYSTNSLGSISSTTEQPVYSEAEPSGPVGYEYLYSNNIDQTKMNYSTKSAINYTKTNGEIVQQLRFIEIPVIANYSLFNKKWQCYLTGGISANILINNVAIFKTSSSEEKIGETSNLNTMSYYGIAGIGFSLPVRKNIRFIFEPTYHYQINSITNNNTTKVHLYSYSIYTGFSFNF